LIRRNPRKLAIAEIAKRNAEYAAVNAAAVMIKRGANTAVTIQNTIVASETRPGIASNK
jgi:hypothetical protein